MKNTLMNLAIIFLMIISASTFYPNNKIKYLEIYYFHQISNNLDHLINTSENIYNLSRKINFKKSLLENELNVLEHEIRMTNSDIVEMIKYLPDENHKELQSYLQSMDRRLAQTHIDIESLKKGLTEAKQLNIPGLISDISHQLKKARNVDYLQIINFQNQLKDYE